MKRPILSRHCGKRVLSGCLLIAVMAFTSSALLAVDFQKSEDDLAIAVQHSWIGGTKGGYHPIRVRATNRGAARLFRFSFQTDSHQQIPSVTKLVPIQQNASVEFTLLVPLVGWGQSGTFKVDQNGYTMKELTNYISLSNTDPSSERPALLVLDPVPKSMDPFEQAVNSLLMGSVTPGPHGHHYYGGSRSENHLWTTPDLLPESWLGYTGLEMVALPVSEFKKLKSEHRQAILQWVQTGGWLLIYNTETAPNEAKTVLPLLDSVLAEPKWTASERGQRQALPEVKVDQYGNVLPAGATPEEKVEESPDNKKQMPKKDVPDAWKTSELANFYATDVMLGKIVLFPENPFPGTRDDWGWFLNSLDFKRHSWSSRHGNNARTSNGDFYRFLIPGVSGIPVWSFLLLITIFSILIGPANYFYLLKKKRLMLLVMTIPIIAAATSVCLVSYSVVAYGFSTRARLRSLTLVDAAHNVAIDRSRNALYSGLAPSEGLRFRPETAVYPLWREDQTYPGGLVDWTDTQHFRSGWFRSRTQTQFTTLTHRAERGRLEISEPRNGKISVKNGFTVPFQMLIVKDAKGAYYFGENLPEGGSAEFSRISAPDVQHWKKKFAELEPQLPENWNGSHSGFGFFSAHHRYHPYYGYGNQLADYNSGTTENEFRMISSPGSLQGSGSAEEKHHITPLENLRGAAFVGMCGKNPGIDFGTTAYDHRASLHVMLGTIK